MKLQVYGVVEGDNLITGEHATVDILIPCFVSVVLEDRRYGGPEEGGWWYTEESRVETHYIASIDVLEKVVERVRRVYDNKGRPPLSSVASRGRYFVQFAGKPAPLYSPLFRPHYE